MRGIQEMLKLDVGETTGNRCFTLETGPCTGACKSSPVMTVDRKVHRSLNVKKAIRVMSKYSSADASAPSAKGGAGAGKEHYHA